ncbi:MAG: AraC family ligand binding domain-containing protein, partial [Bacteroidetes bacterium]|nr:AraC family ligand binding domain-containing protein [Bacteroidota bacterium]
MKKIPVRKIITSPKEQIPDGRFSIREVEKLFNGSNLGHNIHRHDFYFVLALQKGQGVHEIDFVAYPVHDHSIFILRPGQVHALELTPDSTGFLMEFDLTFYQPKKSITEQRWRKASGKSYCEVEAAKFMKLHAFLAGIFSEFSNKQDGYIEAIKANMDLFFIEYVRQSRNPKIISKTGNVYTEERFEELMQLLEANIGSMKNVSDYADLLN